MKRVAYIVVFLAAAAAVGFLAWSQSGCSRGGALVKAHAPLEGDCSACHDAGRGVSVAKCSGCHTDPATGAPADFVGFARHHTFSDLNCLECHTAHQGRRGMLLKRGKSFRAAGCGTCHERHVGAGYVYRLAAYKHPDPCLRKSHQPWQRNCTACHTKGSGAYNCTTCHDPQTGKQIALNGFASHHFRKDLTCLTCHAEHRGVEGQPVTKPGVTFSSVPCDACHKPDTMKPVPIDKLSVAVRGKTRQFLHAKHPVGSIACGRCHPMAKDKPHVLVGQFSENCSSCHHGSAQRASCDTCHKQAADYFAGKWSGRIVRRGTHGKSGEVTCVGCHIFDAKTNTFGRPVDTCSKCHPKAYTAAFVKSQAVWQQWRKTVEALPAEYPYADQLKFIGRYWYHNDIQSEKVRKAYPAPGKSDAN